MESFQTVAEYTSIARETFIDAYKGKTENGDLYKYIDENFTEEGLEQELLSPHCIIRGLWNDAGEMIGYLKLRWDRYKELCNGEEALEIQRIYLSKKYWGKGLGDVLMEICENFALANRFPWVWLCVWEKNSGAIRFYERHGYRKFGTIDFKYGDSVFPDPVYRKRIEFGGR